MILPKDMKLLHEFLGEHVSETKVRSSAKQMLFRTGHFSFQWLH